MNVQHASVFDLRGKPPEEMWTTYGLRVLVMRQWPRGVSRRNLDLWVPDAGPSRELLKHYHAQELDWEQFSAAYMQEQAEARGGRLFVYPRGLVDRIETRYPVRPVALLAWYARRQPMTLFCWERTGNCHRTVLLDLVQSAVIQQEELLTLQGLPQLASGPFLWL